MEILGIRVKSWQLIWLGLSLAVAIPLAIACQVGILSGAQVAASDLLFRTHAVQPAESTVIIGIDQRSYRSLLPVHGPLSQWPRSLYAQVLDALNAPVPGAPPGAPTRPRVAAFGVFFDSERPEDVGLAAAMRRAGNVVLPVVAQGARDFEPGPGVAQRFDVFLRPPADLRAAAEGEGLANVTVAPDSVVRGLPLLLTAGHERLPSIALTLAALYARRPTVLDREPRPGVVHAAGREVPVSESDIMTVNFLGPPSTVDGRGPVRIVPFVDVLEGRFDRALVRDRIALIGPTIRGVDEYSTPTTSQTRMWGIEILAQAIETVVHQRFLVPAPAWLTIGAIIGLGVLGGGLTYMRSPWRAAFVALVLVALYLTAAAVAFEGGIVANLIYPPAALLGAFGVTLAHRVVFAERGRRLAREAMDRYLSPSVGRWVLADPRRLSLGGELREMTVLFMDLRQFTTLSHSLPPETLVELLNRYRAIMSDVVFAHDGVIVQYAGDAIEAFWNAPMDQPDHARRACAAALDMSAAVAAIRPEFEAQGWEGVELGIGINTGRMVVGNFGSRRRLEYAVVGDPVNVAARLEGLTKLYGVRVIAGDDTRAAAGDAFEWRFLDLVAVKGRPEPLRVWEVVGRADQISAERRDALARYAEGVDLYRSRRFEEAAARFGALAADVPGDGPVELYVERSRRAVAAPPPLDWDGVHIAQIK